MTHLHNASGLYFECGELMDFPDNGNRKTYDMTVVTLWGCTEGEPEAPIIIGYYFGEYNEVYTDECIDRWFKECTADAKTTDLILRCRSIVRAYWLTNEDVLIDDEYGMHRSLVKQTLSDLNEFCEVIDNE